MGNMASKKKETSSTLPSTSTTKSSQKHIDIFIDDDTGPSMTSTQIDDYKPAGVLVDRTNIMKKKGPSRKKVTGRKLQQSCDLDITKDPVPPSAKILKQTTIVLTPKPKVPIQRHPAHDIITMATIEPSSTLSLAQLEKESPRADSLDNFLVPHSSDADVWLIDLAAPSPPSPNTVPTSCSTCTTVTTSPPCTAITTSSSHTAVTTSSFHTAVSTSSTCIVTTTIVTSALASTSAMSTVSTAAVMLPVSSTSDMPCSSSIATKQRPMRKCPFCDYNARADNVLKHLKSVHQEISMTDRLKRWECSKDTTNTSLKTCPNCEGRFKKLPAHLKHCTSVKHTIPRNEPTFYSTSTQTDFCSVEKVDVGIQWVPQYLSSTLIEPNSSTSIDNYTTTPSSSSSRSFSSGSHPPSRYSFSSSTDLFHQQLGGLQEYDYDMEGKDRTQLSERDKRNFTKFTSFLHSLIKVKLTKHLGMPCDLRHLVTQIKAVKLVNLNYNKFKENSVSTYISHIRHALAFILKVFRSLDQEYSEYRALFEPLTLEKVEAADERYRCMKVTAKRRVQKYTAAQKPVIRSKLLTQMEMKKIRSLYDSTKQLLDSDKVKDHFSTIKNNLLVLCMTEMPLRVTPYLNLSVKHVLNGVDHEPENSVFMTMPEVEHKCETMGPLEIVLSKKLHNLIFDYINIFSITGHVFCSEQNHKPYKSTSALSNIVFKTTESLLTRRIGPCYLRKFVTTAIQRDYPELSQDTCELLQHSEKIARDNYTASISVSRKVFIAATIRKCLGFDF